MCLYIRIRLNFKDTLRSTLRVEDVLNWEQSFKQCLYIIKQDLNFKEDSDAV